LESGDAGGVVALRPRSSKERYDENEIDFLTTLCTQSAEILGRLQLQERVLLEREAKKRSEELNALKSEIVSYVSHEFRTPLTSIKMFSDLLRRRIPARDSKASEYIDIIDGESDRLNRMVTNLLDAARIEKGVREYLLEEIDLGEVAKDVLESMRYQLKKYGCKLETRISKRKLSIHADGDAVAQSMMNILTNSIKYSSKERIIKVEVQKRGTWAAFRVTDHGDGISKEALPLLFEKFYREPSHSGTVEGVGLGLPLVKHIMEAHGGRVEVQSTPGKGSSFVLLFPINQK
jgi:two-component system phosphate regulon sensor histidine kinase PhoR